MRAVSIGKGGEKSPKKKKKKPAEYGKKHPEKRKGVPDRLRMRRGALL